MDFDLGSLESFPAAAEYLADIYLIQRDYGSVSNRRLAEWLGVTTSAVSQAAGRLKKLGLIDQPPYGDIVLTGEGRRLAAVVLRRHYLLEHVLVRILDFPWDKADHEARVLQQHISSDLASHIDAHLGHPQTCPHGNPLPGVPIERELLAAPRLADAVAGQALTILRVTEEGEAIPEMLPFCQANAVRPAAKLEVLGRDEAGVRVRHLSAPEGAAAGSWTVPLSLARHIGYRPIAD
jgi:DtxR family Mn-dependent transcriptional regulator